MKRLTAEQMSKYIDDLDGESILEAWVGEKPLWEIAAQAQLDRVREKVLHHIKVLPNPFEGYVDVVENIRMAKSQGFERFREALKSQLEER